MEGEKLDFSEQDQSLPVVLKQTDRWEGEDEDEDVKDNWDDPDEEPKSESQASDEQPKPKAAVLSKKKQLAQKIAEKEAARIKVPLTAEEALADKLEKQRLQEESDLKLTQESFGISDAGTAVTGSGLESVKLATKDDFEVFKKSLVNRLQLAEKSPHYVNFLDASFRDICASLEPDDIKRLSSSLNTLFNEKVKAQKGPKAKKGKVKGVVKVERDPMDYDGNAGYDDFDEFV